MTKRPLCLIQEIKSSRIVITGPVWTHQDQGNEEGRTISNLWEKDHPTVGVLPSLPLMLEAPAQPIWLHAAKLGESWALEQLYSIYQPMVYTLCFRLLGNADDAEDAMQAAFVCAFRGLSRFRGESSVKTWLYRIAVNESMSLLRKRKNAPLPLDELLEIPGGAPDCSEDIAVRAALAQVKPDHRAVLILRFWEDLSYEEIAAALGISLAAARMRLKRAKAEFRKYYQEDL